MKLTEAIRLSGEIGKPLCCIARFSQSGEAPHVFYQIIVDPQKVTRSGKFIKLEGGGNDIYGFKPMDSLEIYEVLGQVEGEVVNPLDREVLALVA